MQPCYTASSCIFRVLEAFLCSRFLSSIREPSLGYMDEMNMLSEDEKNIIVADVVCRPSRRLLALTSVGVARL
jgi:hypothetical protein